MNNKKKKERKNISLQDSLIVAGSTLLAISLFFIIAGIKILPGYPDARYLGVDVKRVTISVDSTYTSSSSLKEREYYKKIYTDYESYRNDYSFLGILTAKDFEKNNYFIYKIDGARTEGSIKLLAISSIRTSYDTIGLMNAIFYHSETDCDYFLGKITHYYAIKLDKSITKIGQANYVLTHAYSSSCNGVWKPMIYIYPEEDMNVEVKLGKPGLLTTTYPKYENSWNVYAHTNGDLEYNGRTYYGLYWEGANHKVEQKQDGFVIKGEDTSKFLEEKLEILGLNEREINEFIIYWLPKMEHNKYNYIRFETKEEIDDYMPMDITPKPDTVIRVYMSFKPLEKEIKVKEQELEKTTRNGYTVVEWGGSVING